MKQVLQYPKKGKLCVEDVPGPALRKGGILVRNVCSLVSAGTERAVIEEAKNIKNVFLTNYGKETPRILSDIPHLYCEEKGKELGVHLFK